jgi:hypothetical protein
LATINISPENCYYVAFVSATIAPTIPRCRWSR